MGKIIELILTKPKFKIDFSSSGGAAERTSDHKLQVGDEILKINGMSIGKQTRIDVWNLMKNLPQGNAVQLTIKRK